MSTRGVNRGCSSELQGIGSILGSDCRRSKVAMAASLRRTLSADMSSRKWLSHHGFSSSSSLKKAASSEEFQQVVNNNNNTVSDGGGEEPPSQVDVWNSIQSDQLKKKKEEVVGSGGKKLQPAESWSSILSQKSAPLPAPYVHPLSKKSRSLSQKSLEICTESLGSETGSDGFSSSSCSSSSSEASTSDAEDEHEQEEPIVVKPEQVQPHDDIADCSSYSNSKFTFSSSSSSSYPSLSSTCSRSVRSFPPPLPSLSRPKLHMRPHRVDGRLVLEAIPAPAPPSHNFHAQRQDGRLRLTFINSSASPNAETTQNQEQEEEKQHNRIEENEERVLMMRQQQKKKKEEKPSVSTGLIDVQLSALEMKKLTSLTNRNTRNWSSKLNQKLGHEIEQDPQDEEEENEGNSAHKPLPVSLIASATRVPRIIATPAATATATAASFVNAYEYFWRTKQATISVGVMNHPVLIQQSSSPLFTKSYTNKSLVSKNPNPSTCSSSQQYYYQNHQKQQFVVLSTADYYHTNSPTIRGCMEPKRSLMIREPCCIATS